MPARRYALETRFSQISTFFASNAGRSGFRLDTFMPWRALVRDLMVSSAMVAGLLVSDGKNCPSAVEGDGLRLARLPRAAMELGPGTNGTWRLADLDRVSGGVLFVGFCDSGAVSDVSLVRNPGIRRFMGQPRAGRKKTGVGGCYMQSLLAK